MKRGLVLSGGGTKGAFQAGVLEVLVLWYGQHFEDLHGVSVGALHVGLLGAFLHDQPIAIARMRELWENLNERDVHTKYSWPMVIARLALGKQGIYDNTPTQRLILKHIGEGPLPATVGLVDVESGEYCAVPATAKTMWASATMPLIWPLVDGHLVDGGVRHVTPLAEAIDAGVDEITVVRCNMRKTEPAPRPRNALEVAKRALDIAMNEIETNDISETQRINELVRQAEAQGTVLLKADGTPYRYIPLTVIEPPQPLGDTLDFRLEKLLWRMELGRAAARRTLEGA